jgi:diphosphomevalonate decarboxylase
MSGSTQHARVTSVNAFPTAAGLASSASGFAALAVAATHAYGLHLPHRLLSGLARRGSGSAARSIYGGFVKMGVEYAEPIEHAKIELCAAIAVAKIRHKESAIESVMRVERELEASQEATRKSEARAVARLRSDSNAGAAPPLDPTLVENTHQKEIGSTDGMRHTAATSPYHAAWLETVDRDLVTAERALAEGDFDALAEVTEASCLAMHADAMAARPGILYFGPVTLWAISRVRALRAAGVPVFFTVDAGPHLVAFTTIEALQRVKETLEENADVAHVITARTGGPAVLEKEGEK